jgi:Domain of unknown function (DUF4350)
LLAALALGVFTLFWFESRLRVSYQTPLSGCAHENGTGGASAVFRWVARIGVPAKLLDGPIWEAPRSFDSPAGNCILTMGADSWSPTGGALDPASWVIMSEWVARGNTLIVVTSSPLTLAKEIGQSFSLSTKDRIGDRIHFFGQPPVESRPETTQAAVYSGGSLVVETNGPRWSVSSSATARPGATATNRSKSTNATDPAEWQLAADQRGGVLFRIPVRSGSIYVLLDEFAWANSGFDQGDNARVLAEILGRELRGGLLAFDEYRHGHGRAESFLVFLMNLPGSSATFWLGATWALLYYYGRNVRLKPVEPYVEHERRTAQEYIDAVAQLYERARAAPLVVEAVARRLRQLSRSAAQSPPAVDALLQAAQDYVKKEDRPAAPREAINLVEQLIQIRKKIYGTRAAS